MNAEELIEALSDKEHASWARWMEYLFSRCEPLIGSGGALIIPAALVERWQRQVNTPYAKLSEREKTSDREEVKHILPLIDKYAEQKTVCEGCGAQKLWVQIDSEGNTRRLCYHCVDE